VAFFLLLVVSPPIWSSSALGSFGLMKESFGRMANVFVGRLKMAEAQNNYLAPRAWRHVKRFPAFSEVLTGSRDFLIHVAARNDA
jgi:hypothetical protein